MFLVVVLIVIGLTMVYPPLRILNWLVPDFAHNASLACLLYGIPVASRIALERWSIPALRAVSAVIMTWMGSCFLAFVLLLPTELLVLSGADAQQLAALLCALVLALSLWGMVNAWMLHVQTLDTPAPEALRGTTIAQISDVHIGSRAPGFLAPIVARVNQLQPDYVVITGDLIDMRDIPREALAALAQFEAPTLFCTGNHERYVDLEAICARLTDLGIDVLRNRSTLHDSIQFIGIDDAEAKTQVAEVLPSIDPVPDAYRILLYHRPDSAEAAAAWGCHLMLTGHTHRGQIIPFNFLVSRVFPRLYRDYHVDDMTLYVSPGTGTWGPVMRIGSKCEITLIRLL